MLKSPSFVAVFSIIYLFVFILIVSLGYGDPAMAMFLLSPILVLWLVYSVLRYGEPSGRTFDEYFYDDVNIRVDKLRK